MGTTLTGTTPQDTYDSLIKVTDNGPLSGTAKYLSDGLGNDSALALSTAGVGIGNSTPSSFLSNGNQLVVGSGAAAQGITIYSNTAGTGNLFFADGTAGDAAYRGFLRYDHNSDAMQIYTAGANERMRITSAGDTEFGDGNNFNPVIQYAGSGRVAASPAYSFRGDLDTGMFNPNLGNTIAFATAATERFRITDNGVTFNGDTAAANALDDYEEGTWTMGISFGGGTTGVTYNFRGATYTKIGRQVTVNGYMVLSSKGSSTGAVAITGLPFTVGGATGNYTTASLRLSSVSFTGQFQANSDISSTTCSLNQLTEAGVISNLENSNFENNSSVMINLTYFV